MALGICSWDSWKERILSRESLLLCTSTWVKKSLKDAAIQLVQMSTVSSWPGRCSCERIVIGDGVSSQRLLLRLSLPWTSFLEEFSSSVKLQHGYMDVKKCHERFSSSIKWVKCNFWTKLFILLSTLHCVRILRLRSAHFNTTWDIVEWLGLRSDDMICKRMLEALSFKICL